MKVFKGLRGIISGAFLMIVGSIVIQPFDWHDLTFIAGFILIVPLSFLMILYGSITLAMKEK